MAGTIGLVQNDIKRVLAYSTVSQLGYMFLAMGVGAYAAGIFHLYTHAFFKALLFLGSGAVIHALAGEQDLRNMGGLKKYLPITYWTFLIGALAIAGVPLLSGFFSKDEILFKTFVGTQYSHGSTLLWVIGAITSLLTATYMFRLVFLTFHGERRTARGVVARRARSRRACATAMATRTGTARLTTRRRRWRFRSSSWRSDRSSPATSASRTRSAATTASRRSSSRASKCTRRPRAERAAGGRARRRAGRGAVRSRWPARVRPRTRPAPRAATSRPS